jgi:hypothetical protein
MTKLFDDGMITAAVLQSPTKSLVYVPTLKCASSYYAKVLSSHNWTPIKLQDIDFRIQTVFGFLLHPTTRYAKGAATDLFEVGIENLVMNFIGARFWEYPPILGVHTVPVTMIYKNIYKKIHWLPLDNPSVDTNHELVKLCQEHNEGLLLPDSRENVSTDHQKKIYQTIEKLVAGAGETWYNMLYPEEIELYNNVEKQYESRTKSNH